MARIILRNTAIPASAPTSLVQGEVAINVTDGTLYYGSGSANTVKQLAAGGGTVDTSSLVTKASFNFYTSSDASRFAGTSTTASYALTASYVLQAVSASYATTASFVTGSNVYGPFGSNSSISASYAATASYVLQAISSSFASTASFLNSTTNAFIQNGNSFGATAVLGTNDDQSLALETSGSTRMFISSSGNVGIRTLTPSATLDVSGSVNISGSGTSIPFQISSGSTSLMYISSSGRVGFGTLAPTFAFQIAVPNGTDSLAVTNGGSTIRLTPNAGLGNPGIVSSGIIHMASPINGTGGTEILQVRKSSGGNFIQYWANNAGTTLSAIDGNGNLGIGTGTTPLSASLHISGASSANLLRIDSPAVNNILFVSGSGRIGIGTAIPQYTLDVSGSANITNGLTVTGSITATSFTGSLFGTASFAVSSSRAVSASVSTNITVTGDPSTNATYYPIFSPSSSGAVGARVDTNLAYNPSTDTLTTGDLALALGGSRTLTMQAQGAGGTEIRLEPNSTAGYARINVGNTNQPLDFQMNSNDVMRITQGYQVGIGTTSPNAKLDVNGDAIITGSLTVTSNITAPNLTGTASYATQALSASYAPGTPAFPFVGSAQITGSLLLSGSLTLSNYTNSGSFPGTGSALLAVNNSGSVITSPFRDVAEQVYTGSIAWTGTAAPSGSTTHTYRWSQIGKTVNLNITLVYTGPGNAVSTVTTALPADCPTPYVPSGQSGAGALISVVSAHLTTTTTIGANVARGGLRINPTNNGYELSATATAAGYKVLVTSVQYFAV